MTEHDVAKIAEGLSPLEAELLWERAEGGGLWMFSVVNDLVGKGLAERVGGGGIRLNALGRQVRQYLEARHDR